MAWQRPDGRIPYELRPISFYPSFTRFAPGSVLARCGDTQVLCTVSVNKGVPKFLEGTGKGWLTAEYRMLTICYPKTPRKGIIEIIWTDARNSTFNWA